jgi:transcriptional regulator with XRE-family HTH domain
MATVGERIRQRRRELGLSQRGFAELGVSHAYISRIEANSCEPSVKVRPMLAPKLGVSTHWLETGEDDPAEQLAHLVLRHKGGLPCRAETLAREILRRS